MNGCASRGDRARPPLPLERSLVALANDEHLTLGGIMNAYRLYFLREDGHISHALEIECESDADAIALVNAHPDGRPKELWEQARRVAVFPASPPPPAS